ncbi:hypothetical protein LXL04_026287 [Taraxacum kok-saghyz]
MKIGRCWSPISMVVGCPAGFMESQYHQLLFHHYQISSKVPHFSIILISNQRISSNSLTICTVSPSPAMSRHRRLCVAVADSGSPSPTSCRRCRVCLAVTVAHFVFKVNSDSVNTTPLYKTVMETVSNLPLHHNCWKQFPTCPSTTIELPPPSSNESGGFGVSKVIRAD